MTDESRLSPIGLTAIEGAGKHHKDQFDDQAVVIDYTNWKNERRIRHIRPLSLRFGSSEWHEGAQWLLRGVEIEVGSTRDFAMKDIHSWKPAPR